MWAHMTSFWFWTDQTNNSTSQSKLFIWGHTNLPGSVGQWLDWILWQKVDFLSDVHSDTELIVLLGSFNTGGSCVTENISSTWIETLQRTLLVTQFNGKKTLLVPYFEVHCRFWFFSIFLLLSSLKMHKLNASTITVQLRAETRLD